MMMNLALVQVMALMLIPRMIYYWSTDNIYSVMSNNILLRARKIHVTLQTPQPDTQTSSCSLTTSKGPHLSILCVHLVDVSHAAAQIIDGHVIPVAVLEVVRLILCYHHLVPTVTCENRV